MLFHYMYVWFPMPMQFVTLLVLVFGTLFCDDSALILKQKIRMCFFCNFRNISTVSNISRLLSWFCFNAVLLQICNPVHSGLEQSSSLWTWDNYFWTWHAPPWVIVWRRCGNWTWVKPGRVHIKSRRRLSSARLSTLGLRDISTVLWKNVQKTASQKKI